MQSEQLPDRADQSVRNGSMAASGSNAVHSRCLQEALALTLGLRAFWLSDELGSFRKFNAGAIDSTKMNVANITTSRPAASGLDRWFRFGFARG
jgi:hypothetical protein